MFASLKSVAVGALTVAIAALGQGYAAVAETTISFRYNDPDISVIEAAIAEFEQANPDIDVELERISWSDGRTQFLREAATGTGPDVVHIAFVWPLELGRAGALLPLNDLIDAHGAQNGFDTFIATDLAVGPDGEIFALPWTADTSTMGYNATVLEEAGVEVPRTWEELKETSRLITERTGKVGFGFPAGSAASNSIWFMVNYYLWSHGHSLIEEDGNGGYRVGLDAETLTEAFTYFTDFMGDGGNPASNIAVSWGSELAANEPIINGEQGIFMRTPSLVKSIIDAELAASGADETSLRTTTVPQGSVGGISHLGGRMLGINANTEHPEEAYRLMQFLTSAGFFSDHLTAQFPAQEPLLAELTFAPALQGFAEQLPNARSWGAYANPLTPIGTMWAEMGREFGSILVDEKTAKEAAQSYIDGLNEMLN